MTSSITVPRKKQIDLLIKEDTILLYMDLFDQKS